MDIQLNMLNQLRDEIEKLNKNKQEVQLKYDYNSNKISSTLNDIQNLNIKFDNDKKLFDDERKSKVICYTWPFHVIVGCLGAVLGMASFCGEIGIVHASLLSVLLCGPIFAFTSMELLSFQTDIWYDYENKNIQRRSERWRKSLFKKYPDLERRFNDLHGLISQISKKEEEISVLENEKRELESKLTDITNLLSNKKDEFISAESQYMGFTLNNVCMEEENKMCEAQIFKKRVLKPNDERY